MNFDKEFILNVYNILSTNKEEIKEIPLFMEYKDSDNCKNENLIMLSSDFCKEDDSEEYNNVHSADLCLSENIPKDKRLNKSFYLKGMILRKLQIVPFNQNINNNVIVNNFCNEKREIVAYNEVDNNNNNIMFFQKEHLKKIIKKNRTNLILKAYIILHDIELINFFTKNNIFGASKENVHLCDYKKKILIKNFNINIKDVV